LYFSKTFKLSKIASIFFKTNFLKAFHNYLLLHLNFFIYQDDF